MKLQTLVVFVALGIAPLSFAQKSAAPSSGGGTSSAHSGSGNANHDFGLGVSSFGGAGGSPALTAWIPLKDRAAVQAFVGIPNTTGNFNFSAGGAYKMTTHGSASNGFHIGGNVLLGALGGKFTVQTGGLLGVHMTPAPSMLFAFDGGPQIGITDGTADFSLSAFSAMIGASLIYLF